MNLTPRAVELEKDTALLRDFLTGLHWLRGAGMETAVIRTNVDNLAALRAYESIGFKTVDKLYLYEKQEAVS